MRLLPHFPGLVTPQPGGSRSGSLGLDLTTRIPAALAALQTGRLDLYKCRILSEDTAALSAEQARQVADRVLLRASEQNPTAFRRAVRRAVLRVDPDGQAPAAPTPATPNPTDHPNQQGSIPRACQAR